MAHALLKTAKRKRERTQVIIQVLVSFNQTVTDSKIRQSESPANYSHCKTRRYLNQPQNKCDCDLLGHEKYSNTATSESLSSSYSFFPEPVRCYFYFFISTTLTSKEPGRFSLPWRALAVYFTLFPNTDWGEKRKIHHVFCKQDL